MKKALLFIALFFGIIIFSMAQTNITIRMTSQNGKVIIQDKEMYNINFSVSGLNSEKDIEIFKNTLNSNPIVKKLEISSDINDQNEHKVMLALNTQERELLIKLLKSINVASINVDKKDYSLDQFDQLNKDLAAKNQGNKQKSTERSASK